MTPLLFSPCATHQAIILCVVVFIENLYDDIFRFSCENYSNNYRFRSRSFEKDRNKPSSSRSRRAGGGEGSSSGTGERPIISDADLEGKTPDEQEMMRTMGFCGFDTTKNKKVDGNDAGEVHVILKRKYRQYMNRKGGFNRPLDFVA